MLLYAYVKYILRIYGISQLYIREVSMFISYDYYRIFYYVAKYGNISKAAKVLLSSQPNVTRTIKNLEGELGCTLFSRTSRGMRLTPEGERLYGHVRLALEHIEAGEAELGQSKTLQSGAVYIAASEVALRCLLLPVLKRFRMLYPGVHLRISNHSTPQAIAALKDGTADIAVVTSPTERFASLRETIIQPVHEVAVCPPSFKDLIGRKVSLAELSNYPLISLGSDTKSFEFYSAFFTGYGLNYHPDIEAFTADQILPMVAADLGIGFVPQEFNKEWENVHILDLEEKIPERNIVLIKRKEQPLSMAARELEKMILSH